MLQPGLPMRIEGNGPCFEDMPQKSSTSPFFDANKVIEGARVIANYLGCFSIKRAIPDSVTSWLHLDLGGVREFRAKQNSPLDIIKAFASQKNKDGTGSIGEKGAKNIGIELNRLGFLSDEYFINKDNVNIAYRLPQNFQILRDSLSGEFDHTPGLSDDFKHLSSTIAMILIDPEMVEDTSHSSDEEDSSAFKEGTATKHPVKNHASRVVDIDDAGAIRYITRIRAEEEKDPKIRHWVAANHGMECVTYKGVCRETSMHLSQLPTWVSEGALIAQPPSVDAPMPIGPPLYSQRSIDEISTVSCLTEGVPPDGRADGDGLEVELLLPYRSFRRKFLTSVGESDV